MSQARYLPSPEELGRWRQAAAKSVPGGDLDALAWYTPEGLLLKPLCTAQDLASLDHVQSLPVFAPHLRG